MIIYLAALQSIPHNLYEAARIDGASEIRIFSSIKIPLLLPSTLFLTITGFIESFQIFDLVYVMTYGGPVDETDVLGFFLYRYGFQYFKLGYASTIAVAIFLILFVLSIIQWRFAKGGQAY
jgi:ABC-type sugar transport system permease subunit